VKRMYELHQLYPLEVANRAEQSIYDAYEKRKEKDEAWNDSCVNPAFTTYSKHITRIFPSNCEAIWIEYRFFCAI
jgi:hypothetical protein